MDARFPMPITPGTRLGPYEAVALLGAGGMGEVWKALDTRLDRMVAVKVLQGSWAEQPEWLGRFRMEAKAVAALNHPNILGIYDLGHEGAIPYAVMELLEGETLRDRLRAGPLAAAQAVDLAQQMAHGLSAAHEKGIIHRDLKPENLWITKEGRLKILDFGLAKHAPAASEDRTLELEVETEAGMVVGTVGYMSPEQVRGEQVDARSDLFSFGAVLWEMLMGRKAFARPSQAETIVAILKEEPEALDRAPQPIPPGLQRTMAHCLAKDPGGRFQSTRDLAFALEAISDAPAQAGPQRGTPSLAVLPFVNLSQSKDQDYFSDGVSEEIINALMKVDGLRVVARTSSFAFKGKEDDVRRIGAALGVKHILEGSVRIAGSKLRVSAQLIAAEDGCQLWSDRFDRSLEDVFEVQDEIARAIADTLKVRLLGGQEQRLVRRATKDPEAYDLFLRGRAFYSQRVASQAIACFEAALARDSGYAEAYTGLADACAVQGYYGGISTRDAHARARAAAEKGLSLAPEAAEPRVSLGILEHYYGWDFAREERELGEALRISPRLATAHYWMSLLFGLRHQRERGLEFGRRCVELDPLNPNAHCAVGMADYSVGRCEEALTPFYQGHALDPGALLPVVSLGRAFLGLGRHDEGIAVLEQCRSSTGKQSTILLGLLCHLYAAKGQRAQAEELLADLQARALREYVAPMHIAFGQCGLGDVDAAMASFQLAVQDRNALLWFYTLYDPVLTPLLRQHPGFEDLRRRILGEPGSATGL